MRVLRVTQILEVIIVAIMALMVSLVFFNVILRYGFNSGATLTEELSRYLFVYLTFLGAILALKEERHVRVSLWVDKFPPLVRHWVHVVAVILMLCCCALVLLGSWQLAILNKDNLSPVSGIPIGLMFLAGVIASLGMGILLLRQLWQRLTTKGL